MIRHRIFRWTTGLSLALCLAVPALAEPQAAPVVAPAPLEAVESTPAMHPALWLVRDDDTAIWLFGTIHLLKPGLNWLNGPVASALEDSDTLVTEVITGDEAAMTAEAGMLARAKLPKGQTLRGLMNAQQRGEYEALLSRQGVPLDTFDAYEPWYPTLVFSMLPLMELGMVPNAGAEERLAAAYGTGRREGLETVEFQLGLFDGLSQEAQLAYLSSTIAQYDQIAPEMEKLVAAWGVGDVDAIGSAMSAETATPEVNEVLLVDRNKTWSKWIAARLAQPGTVFLAVGAGHLAGPDSVQRQLAAAGIKTERVQ